MVVVEINGGLGNQMFQYALYLKFKSLGKDVCIDDEILVDKLNDNRALKVFDVFNLKYDLCSKSVSHKMADEDIRLLYRLRRKIFGRKSKDTFYAETDLENNYYPQVLSMDNVYLAGVWQCENYFSDIRDSIIKNYTFKYEDINRPSIKRIVARIADTNSVSIHLRKGDYVNNPGYDDICTLEYYEKAIAYIKECVDNPVFYVFSDDISFARNVFDVNNYVFVDEHKGITAHCDMYLMTKCKHNIIVDSSFSWWGAWLNQNDEKIVICPPVWNSKYICKNTPCSNWVKI